MEFPSLDPSTTGRLVTKNGSRRNVCISYGERPRKKCTGGRSGLLDDNERRGTLRGGRRFLAIGDPLNAKTRRRVYVAWVSRDARTRVVSAAGHSDQRERLKSRFHNLKKNLSGTPPGGYGRRRRSNECAKSAKPDGGA